MMTHEYTAVISERALGYGELYDNFDVVALSPDPYLDSPVSSHPDMIMSIIGETLFVPAEYYKEFTEIIDTVSRNTGLSVCECYVKRSREYPWNIALNVAIIGKRMFSLTKYTADEILRLSAENGIYPVNVKQGYSACTTLVLNENAIITADPSISTAAERLGIDVLRISDGYIKLEGYNTGFIGGASGVCGDTIYFFGNVFRHPDGKKISDFCSVRNMNIKCLSDAKLCDLGGIKFYKNL